MQSAILWYDTFKSCLEEIGFKVNPHDKCVANMVINGKQCTICWYVDDTKISHVDSKIVDQVIKKIEESFGKMTVTRGKTHNFVGMDIDFKDNGSVGILMQEYIKECFIVFGEKISTCVNAPGKHDFFTVTDEKTMSEERMEIFLH